MASRDELLRIARDQREMAARVRRLARGLSLNADHDRMMRQADELEVEATHLERQAAAESPSPAGPPAPQVQQTQVQQQQQHEVEGEPEQKPPSKS
jgi:hypothetical protein